MNLPRITLVSPSYNQAQFLQATLDSVVAQNYPNLEWIVMDGGSADGSVEILRRYEKHFSFWTSERDAGQADALQRGFARATGEILSWLNSDDVLRPNALRTVGEYFAAHPECDFLTGDGVFINAEGTRELFYVRGAPYSFAELLQYCNEKFLPQPSVFFSRASFERVGGLDVTLHYALDLDLWLRLRAEFKLVYVPHCFSQMRVHAHAKTQDAHQPGLREVARVTRRYWNRVGRAERVGLWFSLRRMQAREYCKQGLARVLEQDHRAGWRALSDALQRDPFILTTPAAQRLMGRLVLPRALRQRFLRVP